ncbi:hypothetical protein ACFYU8_18100 [Brevibacillus sp. NPDC003359]|uniref:hypothetical protein n=1 Tax=unclassified Brevibacillus TaxID=2684853 RepID=UPI0036BCF817
MKLNWINRAINGYQRVEFSVGIKQYNQLDRLKHAVNYFREREDNGEDTFVCTDIPSISRVFIITGIEHAMRQGFLPFAKAVYHHLHNHYFMDSPNGHSFKKTYAYLHVSEQKAIHDLYAMIQEYVEDEHLNHMQQLFIFTEEELIRFFIKYGCNELNNKAVKEASRLLSVHSI